MIAALALAGPALADNVDPACRGTPIPDDYDDQLQQDFLANYFALALSLSPLHGPIADAAGHGSIGLDLLGIPPLACRRRFVLGHTKTEDTNFTPVAPRFRATFAFPEIGRTHLYAGAAYVPPVTVFGMRSVIAGVEAGAGWPVGDRVSVGVRAQGETVKTIGEVATPFVAGDPAVDDYYNASTLGGEALVGVEVVPAARPYLAVGLLDASTFFWVGDDGLVVNNVHPYLGPVASLGVDGLAARDRLRYAIELYGAPGGHDLPSGMPAEDPSAAHVTFGNSGHLYTVRARIAWEL